MSPTLSRPLASRPAPGRRADYVQFRPLALRWMDNDVFGHVNNAHYYSLFDTTVCDWLVSQGVLDWPKAGHTPDHFMVIAENGCRYHSEIAFPQPIVGALRVSALGTRSVRYEIAVFLEEADTASAEGFMVHVCVAATTRRPAPIPEPWRATLQQLIKE